MLFAIRQIPAVFRITLRSLVLRLVEFLSRKSFFNAPSALKTHKDSEVFQSNSFGPFCDSQGFSLERYFMISRGPITRLLFCCGPSAIFRKISQSRINSINRVSFRRAFSHVGFKSIVVVPSFTDCNGRGFTSIKMPIFKSRIYAAANHCFPNVIKRFAFIEPTPSMTLAHFAFDSIVSIFANTFIVLRETMTIFAKCSGFHSPMINPIKAHCKG